MDCNSSSPAVQTASSSQRRASLHRTVVVLVVTLSIAVVLVNVRMVSAWLRDGNISGGGGGGDNGGMHRSVSDLSEQRDSAASSNPHASVMHRPTTTPDEIPARLNVDGAVDAAALPPDRAVIAMIAHGWNAKGYEDGTTIKGSRRSMDLALRGILRFVSTACTLHFYFITGEEDEARIRDLLRAVTHVPTNVTYHFLRLDEVRLREWMDDIGHRATHRTGAAGNIKFFYPLLFPNEDRMMMLDSDVLVARDICDLWAHFSHFGPQQLFSFSPQANPMSHTRDNQFNAGVALLHLRRMRDVGWLALAKNSIRHWHSTGMQPRCCAHGDQSVFHMIRYYQPQTLVHYLPRWWNINKCHQYQQFERHFLRWQQHKNKTTKSSMLTGPHVLSSAAPSIAALAKSHNRDEVFLGLVHLGCCKMCRRESLHGRWRALLDDILAVPLTNSTGPGRLVEK